jgi:hypothetical protein
MRRHDLPVRFRPVRIHYPTKFASIDNRLAVVSYIHLYHRGRARILGLYEFQRPLTSQ